MKIVRELEVKYEALYQEFYDLRKDVIVGKTVSDQDALLKRFEERAVELDDENYKALEVEACDAVQEVKGDSAGVKNYWLKGMLNQKHIMSNIEEKDRSVLESLIDIRIKYHEKGHGYDLTFFFAPNDHFENETLTKSFQMSKPNMIEKAEGCEIMWKENMNITVKKVKNKKKKGKATGTKTVDAKTFFTFFKTQEMPDFKKIMESGQNPDDLDEENMRELGTKMDEDFDLGNEIKEQLIPLVLEYYLDVIEFDESDDEEGSDGSDDGGDSDGSDEPKPRKGGNKRKGSGASGGSGGAAKGAKKGGKDGKGKEDCKQQ